MGLKKKSESSPEKEFTSSLLKKSQMQGVGERARRRYGNSVAQANEPATQQMRLFEQTAKAKKDAFRLLSFRARSTAELRERLLRKKYSSEITEEVILFCSKQGLLDDEKFAKLYALSRIQSRPTGKKMIQFALRSKGVAPGVVNCALDSIEDFDEKQIALESALRRHRRMTGLPQNISKARIYGFLKRRGFTNESVFYALSKLYRQTEDF